MEAAHLRQTRRAAASPLRRASPVLRRSKRSNTPRRSRAPSRRRPPKAASCRKPIASPGATAARPGAAHAEGDERDARGALGEARAPDSRVRDAGGSARAGLDRREGDGQGGRAAARRRGVPQSPAPPHAPAVGPDRGLCAHARQGCARTRAHACRSRLRGAATTPISWTACRRRRSAIRARRPSWRSFIPPRATTSISWRTAPAAMSSRSTLAEHNHNVARLRQMQGGALGQKAE